MVDNKKFLNSMVQMPTYEDLDLFKVFRDFDENEKDFLEPIEYKQCLKKFEPLGLLDREITSVILYADFNRDQRIDYQDFMKHFRTTLFIIKFQTTL